jgi:hypothetical protein
MYTSKTNLHLDGNLSIVSGKFPGGMSGNSKNSNIVLKQPGRTQNKNSQEVGYAN